MAKICYNLDMAKYNNRNANSDSDPRGKSGEESKAVDPTRAEAVAEVALELVGVDVDNNNPDERTQIQAALDVVSAGSFENHAPSAVSEQDTLIDSVEIDELPKKSNAFIRSLDLAIEDMNDLASPRFYFMGLGGLAVRTVMLGVSFGKWETRRLRDRRLTTWQMKKMAEREKREFSHNGKHRQIVFGTDDSSVFVPTWNGYDKKEDSYLNNKDSSFNKKQKRSKGDLGVPLRADKKDAEGHETSDRYKTKQMMNDLLDRYKHSPAALAVMAALLDVKFSDGENAEDAFADTDPIGSSIRKMKVSIDTAKYDHKLSRKLKHLEDSIADALTGGSHKQAELDRVGGRISGHQNAVTSAIETWKDKYTRVASVLETGDLAGDGAEFTDSNGAKFTMSKRLVKAADLPEAQYRKTMLRGDKVITPDYHPEYHDTLIELSVKAIDGTLHIVGYIDGASGGIVYR